MQPFVTLSHATPCLEGISGGARHQEENPGAESLLSRQHTETMV